MKLIVNFCISQSVKMKLDSKCVTKLYQVNQAKDFIEAVPDNSRKCPQMIIEDQS